MKFPRTSPRVVILVASVISVVGFCVAFWSSPQSAQVKRKVTKLAAPDEITDVIRDPQKSLVRVRVHDQKDRESAAKLGTIVADDESFVLVAADSLSPTLSGDLSKVETSINLPGSSFDPLKNPPAGTFSAEAALVGKG